MLLTTVAALLLAAAPPTPVLVEAGATTSLGRHLCAVSGDDRVKLVDGRLVISDQAAYARLSVTVGECDDKPETLAVSVVPALPRDAAATAVFVAGESRLELRGGTPARSVIWWRTAGGGTAWSSGTCDAASSPTAPDASSGPCAVNAGAATTEAVLRGSSLEVLRLPPGSPAPTAAAGSGVAPEIWRAGTSTAANEAPVPLDALRAAVQRVVIDGPLVRATSVEAWREQSELPLAAPGLVAAVYCRSASCWLSDDRASIVVVPPQSGDGVTITATLRDRVFLRQGGDGLTSTVAITLPLARCQVRPLIPAVLGGTEDHRLPLAVADGCPSDLAGLSVETNPPSGAYVERLGADGKQLLVRLGHVPVRADALEVRLLRASTRAIVGTARVAVLASYAPNDVTLSDPHLGELTTIPTNREVRLQWAFIDPKLASTIAPVAMPGYYSLRQQDGATYIRGESRIAGLVPLRFAYVAPPPPAAGAPSSSSLSSAPPSDPLVVFDTAVRFPIKPVNVPVSLAPEDPRTGRIFAVFCRNGDGSSDSEKEVAPGDLISLPYSARGSCRLKVDHRGLATSDGTQRVRVTVKVSSPNGAERAGGFSQVLVLSASNAIDSISLGSKQQLRPFDHLSITLAHDDLAGHYLGEGDAAALPARRYQMIFGDMHLRLYGSATIPTGLYRIAKAPAGGLLQFSAGALMRLAWLDREGREFPADLEFALLGTNLSGQADLSIVTGVGIAVPLLNAQETGQATIGIHAWVEFAPTRTKAGGRPVALIFGPSISIGDFGVNL